MTIFQDEIWKEVPGFPLVYGKPSIYASDFGRIKIIGKNGDSVILKELKATNGYLSVYIPIHIVGKTFRSHVLVCMAWHKNPDNKPHVNHINCIRYDNRPINLEWVTPKENSQHAKKLMRLNMSKTIEDLTQEVDPCTSIKNLRVLLRLTQDEFAQSINSTRGRLGSYEERRCSPPRDLVISICRKYGITVEKFYLGDLSEIKIDKPVIRKPFKFV